MEDLGVARVGVEKRENGGDVAASVAIVRRRPDSDELVVEPVLVALLHELMSATDELELVHLVELVHHFGTE